jgi:hypothetical protein
VQALVLFTRVHVLITNPMTSRPMEIRHTLVTLCNCPVHVASTSASRKLRSQAWWLELLHHCPAMIFRRLIDPLEVSIVTWNRKQSIALRAEVVQAILISSEINTVGTNTSSQHSRGMLPKLVNCQFCY